MQTVGSYEAKTHLPRLLSAVAQGDTIVITKHGKPIAKIIPFTEGRPRDKRAVVEAIRALRQTVQPLTGITAKDLINEGRRI